MGLRACVTCDRVGGGCGGRLFFLLGGGQFRVEGLLFLLVGTALLRLFLGGFLLVGFRGFVAHGFVFFCGLARLRHVGFSEWRRTVRARPGNVNGAGDLISRLRRAGLRGIALGRSSLGLKIPVESGANDLIHRRLPHAVFCKQPDERGFSCMTAKVQAGQRVVLRYDSLTPTQL